MMNIKIVVIFLSACTTISGCTGLAMMDPFLGISKEEAHAMSLCGMGLVQDEGALKTRLEYELLGSPELAEDKRIGVKDSYDSCLKNISRGFNDNPENIPEGYPKVEVVKKYPVKR